MAKTVLIVEDNGLNMKLFDHLLRSAGYETFQAQEGRLGFELAKQHRPDLMLMDIQLPDISGLEVTALIKEVEELRGVPIIGVTAFAMKWDRQTIFAHGLNDYMAKPIDARMFLDMVSHNIG